MKFPRLFEPKVCLTGNLRHGNARRVLSDSNGHLKDGSERIPPGIQVAFEKHFRATHSEEDVSQAGARVVREAIKD